MCGPQYSTVEILASFTLIEFINRPIGTAISKLELVAVPQKEGVGICGGGGGGVCI